MFRALLFSMISLYDYAHFAEDQVAEFAQNLSLHESEPEEENAQTDVCKACPEWLDPDRNGAALPLAEGPVSRGLQATFVERKFYVHDQDKTGPHAGSRKKVYRL